MQWMMNFVTIFDALSVLYDYTYPNSMMTIMGQKGYIRR